MIVDAQRPKKRPGAGSETAPIGEAREEILRLIARLHGTGTPRPAGAAPRREGAAEPGAPGRSADDRRPGESRTVAEVRQLRERLEDRLNDVRLAMRLKELESRVAQVEKLLERRRSTRPDAPAGGGDDVHTVSGELRGQLMPDMLQLLSSNALTGVFVVKSGDSENRLYLDEGQICHAEGPGVEGESAFFAIMALEEGRYLFDETAELPKDKTITGNTQFLILEALRQIDEGGGE